MTEYRKKDVNGRIALSSREYAAIRAIYGAVNSLTEKHGELERRCKGIKNGWRDIRCLVTMAEKLLYKILMTVPADKLLMMKKEMQNTYCITECRGVTGKTDDGFVYIEEQKIVDLAQMAVDMNCLGCTKNQREAKRECSLYKVLESLYPYDFDKHENCQFGEML